MSKAFDIIVHGATGFTGGLVCRALLSEADSAIGAPNALKWAIAGRSERKLQETKDALKVALPAIDPKSIDAIPIVIADSMDEAKIVQLVDQTKVVLSLVGPYKRYGETLVKACAERGVHYCDLTGESIWVRQMIDKYQASAKKSGAMIVNFCGFDSVPSDLSTYLLVDSVRKNHDSETSRVNLFFTQLKGGLGGGTMATFFNMMDTCTAAELKSLRNPYILTDEGVIETARKSGLLAANSEATALNIRKEPEIDRWSGFFFMTPCNQAVVHRTNYLLGGSYGDSFVYRERKADMGFFSHLTTIFKTVVNNLLMYFSPTRAILRRLAPQPGQGPPEDVLNNGHFEIRGYAYDANNKLAARLHMVGSEDPGCVMTSRVIAECAKCLATGDTISPQMAGGFYTTSAAFGHRLRERIERKNILKIETETV